MTTTTADAPPAGASPKPRKKSRINRFDNPWLNWKFIVGLSMVLSIVLMGVIGQYFWDPKLSYPASSPLNLPPPWVPGLEAEIAKPTPERVTPPPTLVAKATAAAVGTPDPGSDSQQQDSSSSVSSGGSMTGGNPFQKATATSAAGGGSVTGGNPFQKATATTAAGSGAVTGGNPLAKSTPQGQAGAGATGPVGAARVARFGTPSWEHPLGTESNGRDMLAVLLVGAPRSLYIGLVAATIGMFIGIILGFTAGYMGGAVDSVIRTLSDSVIVIPALTVLIVIGAYVKTLSIENMALLIALFAWPAPTRYIRAQVLSMRERGYVNMARISGASSFDIMFKEMMPNMLPYIAASYTGNVSGAILAATGLEALGLGTTRIPTLGMTVFYAIRAAAILRGMWWWWGIPIAALVIVFTGLFLMTTGLDEIANPRLRGRKSNA